MKILQKIRSMGKRSKLVVASLTLVAMVGLPLAVNAGFFPGRPTFDYNKFDPNNLNCNDPNNPAAQNGRCGSMTGPVFNSFVNSPSYGDERYFVDGRRTDQPQSATSDTIKDVTEGSKQVTIRLFIHNNANESLNCTAAEKDANGKCKVLNPNAPGVARNTKVKIELPTKSGSALQAVGAISADNAVPQEVSDTVYLTADRKFKVEYLPGSAKLMRNNVSFPLSDSIVTNGAPVGHTQMDGIFPGCFPFEALVFITVNIVPEESNKLQLVKQVKKTGVNDTWHKEVALKPNEEAQYLLTTKNIGLDQLTKVQVRDILPPHVDFVEGSVELINADQVSHPQEDGPLFGNGIGLGTYPSGGGRYVLFKVKTLDDFDGCQVRVRNVAKAKAEQVPNEIRDHADIVITKENCVPEQPEKPQFACELLTLKSLGGRKVQLTASASASGGAEIKRYIYNFGDGSEPLTTDKTTVEYEYQEDGTFNSSVQVVVEVDGEEQIVTSNACVASITFKPGKPPVVTPPKPEVPTKLPEAGAGDVIAAFFSVTVGGMVAYHIVLRRFAGL